MDLKAAEARDQLLARPKGRASNLLPVGRTGAFNYWNADAVPTLVDLPV